MGVSVEFELLFIDSTKDSCKALFISRLIKAVTSRDLTTSLFLSTFYFLRTGNSHYCLIIKMV